MFIEILPKSSVGMKSIIFAFLCALLLPFAAGASGYNVSGKILKPDGTPYSSSATSFILEVTSPDGACVLYREQINNVDMSSTKGGFHIVLGSGAKLFSAVADNNVESVFSNDVTYACNGGTTYVPQSQDERSLKISFHDGTSWQSFSQQPLKAVPRATLANESLNAKKVGGFDSSQFLRSSVNMPELTDTQVGKLQTLLDGSSADYVKAESDPTVKGFAKTSLPTCTTGQVLKSDGTGFQCVNDNAGVKPATACTSSQTLTFISVSDSWSCVEIALTLNGDVTGSHTGNIVSKIRGIAVSSTMPTSGQVLKFNGSQWAPASETPDAVTSVAGKTGAVTLDYGDIQSATARYMTYKPNGTACNDGQMLKWNSTNSRWECGTDTAGTITGDAYLTVTSSNGTTTINANVGTVAGTLVKGDDDRLSNDRKPTGTASGDLGGSYPSPTVVGIAGRNVDVTGLADGDSLVFNSSANKWIIKKAANCDSGWTKVNKGASFCFKAIDASIRNYPQSVIACGDSGADLCSPTQLIYACRDTNKLPNGASAWSGALVGGSTAISISCTTTGGAYSIMAEDISVTKNTYCCKPLNY